MKVKKYCSEIDWINYLKSDCINLIVAPTGSGKSQMALDFSMQEMNVAFCAPFLSITQQVKLNYPHMDISTGTKVKEEESFADGRITSFHSAPRLLELKNIDLLIIDEIHYLVNYAGFSFGAIGRLWETIDKLKKKHPHMRILALTGTPHFVRKANFLNFNEIVVQQTEPTSKPSEIFVSRSWTKEYAKNNVFIALYPSKKMGKSWANKYHGAYIDSATKATSDEYQAILQGRLIAQKTFTSTVLSTGVSILDAVDIVYTNWLSLTDCVQFSSRPRQGGHQLKVTQTPKPFFLQGGCDKPNLSWTKDYEKNFYLLNKYEEWVSYNYHQTEEDLYSAVFQMLWAPQNELPEPY